MLDFLFWTFIALLALSLVAAAFGMYSDEDLFVIGGGAAFFIALIGATVVACIHDAQYKRRLMNECLASGKKEFECYSMLKTDTTVIPMPIVIPTR